MRGATWYVHITMSERIPKPPLSEKQVSPDQEEQYNAWIKNHPETEIAPDTLRESAEEIAEFDTMIDVFESEHPLEELLSIVDLTPEQAMVHPVREPARKALSPIVAKLHALRDETNITPEKYKELQERYKRISRAVGIINNNKIDHTR
jgi:hypothetical protein